MAEEKEWNASVTWRIDDYTSCSMETGERLDSPVFTVEALENSQWFISVYPSGWKNEDKDSFTCFLYKCKNNGSKKGSNITFEFQISAEHGKTLMTHQYSKIINNGFGSGPPKLIKLKEVLAELEKGSSDTLLIKCLIKRNDRSKKLFSKKELRTRIVSHKCSFEWMLKFFKYPQAMKGKKYFSLGDQFYQIRLAIILDDINITVQMLNVKPSNNVIIGKIALLDVNGSEVFWKRDTYKFDEKLGRVTWEFPSLLTKKQLMDNINEYVINGQLLFRCEFSVFQGKKSEIVPNLNCSSLDSLISLSDDIRGLLVDKTNFDVKLLAANKVELRAHRSVLSTRSPLFCDIFEREMIENRTGVVKLEDIDSNTLESFLKFLYNGVMEDMDREKTIKLLLLAEKYQVESVKDVCARFLMTFLSVDNVCEILIIADMIHHEELKTACLDFSAQHVTTIFSSSDFANWIKENPKLASEITLYLGKTVETIS